MANSNEISPIKDIVNKVITNLSSGSEKEHRLSEEDIKRLWREAAGKLASSRSRPISLRKGKLIVAVEDSSMLYALTLRRRKILETLARDLKDAIQDVQFRIGETSGKEKPKGKSQKSKA